MHKPCVLTPNQQRVAEIARVGFMTSSPFYAHIFYAECKEVFTTEVPTAATDGRRIYINPEYLEKLKPAEAVFVYAHEVDHIINRDPQRMRAHKHSNDVRGKPFDAQHFNVTFDYRINAGLIEQGVGMMNPSWCYAPDVSGDEIGEDVYVKKWKDKKGGGSGAVATTWGSSGKAPKGAQPDAASAQHGMDQLMEPEVDPVTGAVDELSDQELKEAVARAATAAKAMGNMPANLQRKIDEILAPQVDWRKHIRMLMTGKIGNRSETWERPNRRRLVLNPLVIMPGRRGYGCELAAVAVDTSGSISDKELNTFLAEVGGILADVRPKEVIFFACDAKVQQTERLRSLDELGEVKAKGVKGGGGTSFIPPFEELEKLNLRPETFVYCTDMMGQFPEEPPPYPVIWAATTDHVAPWGETIRVQLQE